MINATLRVRCISASAMQAIVELLREESNAVFIETFHTQEAPRTGGRASLTVNRADRTPGDRLGSNARSRRKATGGR